MSRKEDIAYTVIGKYLRPGMTVLDAGCGSGSLSLFAASLVGADGNVLGVDTNAATIAYAESQRDNEKLDNLTFYNIPVDDVSRLGIRFDAVIGKDILQYVKDARSTIESLKKVLKPKGYLIFIESDAGHTEDEDLPSVKVRRLIWDTLEKEGSHIRVGSTLDILLKNADFRIRESERHEIRDKDSSALFMEIRRMRQRMINSGVVTEESLDIDNLEKRLSSEAEERGEILRDIVYVVAASNY